MDERGKNWNIGKDFSFRNQEDVSKAVEVNVRKEERQKSNFRSPETSSIVSSCSVLKEQLAMSYKSVIIIGSLPSVVGHLLETSLTKHFQKYPIPWEHFEIAFVSIYLTIRNFADIAVLIFNILEAKCSMRKGLHG